METLSASSAKTYRLGNSNKKNELKIVGEILGNIDDLEPVEKMYVTTRFFNYLFAMDHLAIQNKMVHNAFRGIILVTGILIPVLINFETALLSDVTIKFIVTVLSVLSSICFGVLQIFKNDIMWVHHRMQFENMKAVMYEFLYLTGSRFGAFENHKAAFPEFVNWAEETVKAETSNYFKKLQIESKDKLGTSGDTNYPTKVVGMDS